ncbi:MAG: oxygenase MpaB family protein [Actinomycetota bacterium]|nr:oxygenase MpaB family protein [Actinomycetota bacterium]
MSDQDNVDIPAGLIGPESFPGRLDDGLFGPHSLTWRVYADPSAQIGMVAAVLMQALNPNMMRLFTEVSANSRDAAGRAARTGQYILTTVFADSAHAEAAGAMVRRQHAHAKWTDPTTGETLEAEKPAWLAWTHNCLIWGVLRACDAFGPALTTAEQDQLVVEQLVSARLVGLNPDDLPATRAALDAYIDEQKDWMAMTLPAAESTASLRRPKLWGNPVTIIPGLFIQDAIIALLPQWAQMLYGLDSRHMHPRLATAGTRAALNAARRSKSYEQVLRESLTEAQAHPYARVKSAAP